MYFAGVFNAFKTPIGDQLNLYLNSLEIKGKPPHILLNFIEDTILFLESILKSLIILCASK